ncbi:MAG TPA: response regulator [Gemmatimonadota bacterium]|jgi:DNA-binding NtrC family response regulator
MPRKVLLVDDEESVRLSLAFWLRRNDFEVTACAGSDAAGRALEREAFDAVISDYRLSPLGAEGLLLLDRARTAHPASRRILITATPLEQLPPGLCPGLLHGLHQKPVDVHELLRTLNAP